MKEIFKQIPSSEIITEKIEQDISNFIKKISEIIVQKKSETIEIELEKKEIKIIE
jgi:hypothetical protein